MVHPTVSHRVSRWQQSLHRPVTSERAIRAGPISDVPYVCNNGRDGAVDGRQPFLPVGVPAVNSGSVAGAAPCLALWRPPAAGGPVALCGSWCSKGRGSPEPLRCRGSGAGFLRHASVLCLEPSYRGAEGVRCLQRGFSTSVCTWATVMLSRAPTTRHRLNPRRIGTRSLLDGPGVSPFRIRGLTAVRGFRAWVARESLRWGGCRLGCLVLPPWD